jgi:hypothetical protein
MQIVVFKKRQILPRYLIYYSRNTVPPALPSAPSSHDVSETLSSSSHAHAARTILWVDSNVNSLEIQNAKQVFKVRSSLSLYVMLRLKVRAERGYCSAAVVG